MKFLNIFSIFLIFIFSNPVASQQTSEAKVGDILKIGNSEKYQYSDVKFPKPNFVIKNGGIANYSKLEGTLVEITKVKTRNNAVIVELRRKDGKKFFGSFPLIKANYKDALASGELFRG